MSFEFNEYLHEQFGGQWSTQGEDHTALFPMAFGNAMATFLKKHEVPFNKELRGNNVRITLLKPSRDAVSGIASLPIANDCPRTPLTDEAFPTLEQLILHESGLSGLDRM